VEGEVFTGEGAVQSADASTGHRRTWGWGTGFFFLGWSSMSMTRWIAEFSLFEARERAMKAKGINATRIMTATMP